MTMTEIGKNICFKLVFVDLRAVFSLIKLTASSEPRKIISTEFMGEKLIFAHLDFAIG